MVYQLHPSKRLHELFFDKPYQGAHPNDADCLFIGLDANYAEDIERQPIWSAIEEYHQDGIHFWQKHGVHHPFLMPNYKGDGKKFHQNFAKLGLPKELASRVSFVELVNVPTYGRSSLTLSDLTAPHLAFIAEAVFKAKKKYVFLTPTVGKLLKQTALFKNIFSSNPFLSQGLKTLYTQNSISFFSHYHFSNYGKFQAQMDIEAIAIRNLLVSS